MFASVVLGVARRRILWIGVTTNPTAQWLAHQITEAFPWDTAPVFLVRDNDGAYGEVFRRRLRAMGIRDRPTAPRSPWQSVYVERVIGSIRRECLDHVIVRDEAHLRRVLHAYSQYYNVTRPAHGFRVYNDGPSIMTGSSPPAGMSDFPERRETVRGYGVEVVLHTRWQKRASR
jgi:hypothetical protein